MRKQLRSLSFGLAATIGLAAFAQPLPLYPVSVWGQVLGCTGSGFVNITTASNTQPALDVDVPLNLAAAFGWNS